MSGWDPAPTALVTSWIQDQGAQDFTDGAAKGAGGGGWDDSGDPAGAFTGIDPQHVSKHDGPDVTCRNCNLPGHFSKDCPDPKQMTGECYNCGQVGHTKTECPNERVEREFTGTCRICEEVGHRGADCPSKGPTICKRCNLEGHVAQACSEKYNIFADIDVIDPDEAWSNLIQADAEGDLDDTKKAVLQYGKSAPDIKLPDMQIAFREAGLKIWLVAREQEVSDTHTIVNFQGEPDCKYSVSFQYGLAPRRAKMAEGWPKTEKENFERLATAGFPMDRMVPKCGNCGELGHGSRQCTEEKRTVDKPEVACSNCKQSGHYLRDCKEARVDKNVCKNCNQPGHRSKECTEPRSAEGVECRVCSEMGHFSRDCPTKPSMACRNCGGEGHRAAECTEERKITCNNCGQDGHMRKECTEPPNPANFTCRNCDKVGHFTKECSEPKNWAKVQCRNCDEFGHGAARCTKPPKPADAFDNAETNGYTTAQGGWDSGTVDHGAAAGGGWDAPGPVAPTTDW